MINTYMRLLIILQTFLFANIDERVANICPVEYEIYEKTITDYLIRMEEDINTYGCKVIPVYSAIIESEKFEMLDTIENNYKLLLHLQKLFFVNKEISNLIFKNENMKTLILENSVNELFLKNFTYISQKELHKKEVRQIEKNSEYLNYIILASFYGKDEKNARRLYKKLKSSISIELIPSFTLVLASISDKYSPIDLLENFAILERSLSLDAIKVLTRYPQYFAYFLYPSREDLNIDNISKGNLKKIQKDIQKKVIYFYSTMYEKYRYHNTVDHLDYTLLSIDHIYPYLLDQYTVPYDDFTKLFHVLIEKGYILSLFEQDKCSPTSGDNFTIFGQGNMQNAIKLIRKDNAFCKTFYNECEKKTYSVKLFFLIANLYSRLNAEEWIIMKNLLENLPDTYTRKVLFMKKLEEIGYFRNIVNYDDYQSVIYDEKSGKEYPKYIYILVTSYPKKDDIQNIFIYAMDTNIEQKDLKNSLNHMMSMDKDTLEEHEFTGTERFETMFVILDIGSDVLDVAIVAFSIASSAPSGGSSIVVGAEALVIKKAIIATMKKFGRKALIKYSKSKVSTSMLKNIKGYAVQNFSRTKVKNGIKKGDKISDKVDLVLAGSYMYLYFNPTNLESKIICEEQ